MKNTEKAEYIDGEREPGLQTYIRNAKAVTDSLVASEQGMLSRTIQTNNRSGTFSAKADYVPMSDGRVRVYDWVHDELGIVPSGTEIRIMSLSEAQSDFRERMANGWTGN